MQKKIFCRLLTAYCLLVFCSCGNDSSQKKPELKSQGQALFESHCTNCHGEDGKLCSLGAKDLSLSNLTKEQRIAIITNGKNTMASFGNVLNQEEINTLADYVATLKTK